MTTLLLLLSLLGSGLPRGELPAQTYVSVPPSAVTAPMALAADPDASAVNAPGVPSDDLVPQAYLPIINRSPSACTPISGAQYSTLSVLTPVTDPPAEANPDINLALRGYEFTYAHLGLVEYGGTPDPRAPKLYTLFADHRVPAFPAVYRVYDWDWDCNCRGDLLSYWPVTLTEMQVTANEALYLPDSGYDIGSGYEALVLYASKERITLKYTGEDHVVYGYTVHVENICVEPRLLELYETWNAAGRGRLPALRADQPFGRAWGTEIGVAIRDTGSFMDPRSRWDWW